MPSAPSVRELLNAAVGALDGADRPGQLRMAEAVAEAIRTGEHLLVQAGTGTGKSLAYLVPALLHPGPVVVATATLGLQAQLVRRDLPRLVEAAEPLLGRRPTFALLKGRNNYACRHRLDSSTPADEAGGLFEPAPTSTLGREVLRAREWAASSPTGDRDDLVPGVSDRAWAQISVSARECLGASRCPAGESCFGELARGDAGRVDLVITNHALLAIDALAEIPVLPEHGVVIVDEAHELIDRVTAVGTAELTVTAVQRAARSAARVAEERAVEILLGVADGFAATLAGADPGPIEAMPALLGAELAALRDAARRVLTSISTSAGEGAEQLLAKRIARTAIEEVADTAQRLAVPSDADVAWLTIDEQRGRTLRVAPLEVAAVLRAALFGSRTVVLTSATLGVGGHLEPTARSFGLDSAQTPGPAGTTPVGRDEPAGETPAAPRPLRWHGLDVGSPFAYPRQGILYVARHLPAPGRDGLSEEALVELRDLIDCAGGRTLGLFSSRRAAEQAAEALRPGLAHPLFCQGEDTLAQLVRQFTEDPAACLFGTLSLWHGIDVPGASCQLVVIDRIPFPRPDEPLAAARARAADRTGRNGFMTVFAAHAAVRLAQGAGRLVRSDTDRGLVAVLDSRLATARYGPFLRSSLPPFWYTTDPTVARSALSRLSRQAPVGSDS